jgi:hypothetical protein
MSAVWRVEGTVEGKVDKPYAAPRIQLEWARGRRRVGCIGIHQICQANGLLVGNRSPARGCRASPSTRCGGIALTPPFFPY